MSQGNSRAELTDSPVTQFTDQTLLEIGTAGSLTQLCCWCQNIFDHWKEILVAQTCQYQHHKNDLALRNSSTAGCSLCSQFLMDGPRVVQPRDICRNSQFRKFDNQLRKGYVRIYVVGISICLSLTLPSFEGIRGNHLNVENDEAQLLLNFCVYIFPKNPQARLAHLSDSNLGHSTSTRDALPVVKKWLMNCQKSHDLCFNSQNHQLPTRLLFLAESKISLCLSKNIKEHVLYATLSHRWGKTLYETLTRSNLSNYQVEISINILPKTFLEAIEIVRYLGFRYLWIDSLCIVQDDPADWDKESSLMTSVYSGSSLNIAASSAVDGDSGCFSPRNSSWRFQAQADTGHETTIYNCFPRNFRHSIRNTPLGSRGWVIQERILSHRTVHFTDKQVFWECCEKELCETFPVGFPSDPDNVFRITTLPLSQKSWDMVVSIYAVSELTYKKDRLVAISGLAQLVHSVTQDHYLAGMWRKDLESHLCWSTFPPGQRISPYVAPSWSWASVDFKKSNFTPVSKQQLDLLFVEILDAHVNLKTANVFGEVLNAYLRLSCQYLLTSKLMGTRSRFSSLVIDGKNYQFLLLWDCCTEYEKLQTNAVMLLLPIIYRSLELFQGLIVERTIEKKGQYRRLGLFRLNAVQFLPRLFDIEGLESAGEEDYVDIVLDPDGKKRYVIDLV